MSVEEPGYGYLIEIQSTGDSRYATWTELEPIPSDPSPTRHTHTSPNKGVPPWVVEPQYLDPADGSAVQFIASGLLPHTAYQFRMRTFRGSVHPEFGKYSQVAEAETAAYVKRYVAVNGDDAKDGSDAAHAWKTLAHGAAALACGQVLMVMPGAYSGFTMQQKCTANARAVVRAPGAVLNKPVFINGSYIVLDGLTVNQKTAARYNVTLSGSHNSLMNVETFGGYGGVGAISADHVLIYHCLLHDAGNPAADGGQGGFVLSLRVSRENVVWSNHLTRGSHDVSLCKSRCTDNRWLNNVMDGGWGMGFETIEQSTGNLFEGNIIWHAGRAVPTLYKPGFEISSSGNTARRNLIVGSQLKAIEVSALCCGDTAVGTLIYNNTLVDNPQCLFQSHNGGTAAYNGNLWANNICVGFQLGADIYLPNVTSKYTHNDFLSASGDPAAKVIIWAHETSENPVALSTADALYKPWSHNMAAVPRFYDPAGLDFHLRLSSVLTGGGVAFADPVWGPVAAGDLGMFGITTRAEAPHSQL
jgi:hypothetical protein